MKKVFLRFTPSLFALKEGYVHFSFLKVSSYKIHGGKQGKGWNILKLRIPNAENTKVADKFLKEGRGGGLLEN